MFKKVLSVLFAAALCLVAVAGTQANAATITMPKDCVWIYYDSNAMDVEEIEPTGQFAEIAKKTQTGSKN